MFIKEFLIRRYGPLTDGGRKVLASFNLFYNLNEEGKTLTIDALLKMMFGPKDLRNVKGVKRVEENPEGYVVIETGAANKKIEGEDEKAGKVQKEIKLPEAGFLPHLLSISALEFKNIFLIRDSDLALAGEGDFYRNITNRLTGLRSDDIKNLREKLPELGRITPGGDFRNTAPDKLKDKYVKAQSLLKRIEKVLAELEEEKFGQFEEELARLEEQRTKISDTLNHYSAAYNRERYEKGQRALDKLQNAYVERKKLAHFNQEEYETWQRAGSNLELLQDDLRRLEEEIEKNKKLLEDADKELKKNQQEHKKVEHAWNLVSGRIENTLFAYTQESSSKEGWKVLIENPYFQGAVWVTVLIFLLSLAGAIIRPDWWLFLLLGGSFILLSTSGWFYCRYIWQIRHLAEKEAKICAEAEKLDLPAENIQVVRAAIGRLNSARELGADLIKDAEKKVEWLQKEEDRLKKELEEKQKRISEEEARINRIRHNVRIDKIEQYASALRKKQDLKNEFEKQKSILESHFGKDSDMSGEEAQIDFWKEQVDSLSNYAQSATDISYSQNTVAGLKEELERVNKSQNELEERFKERSEDLRDIEKELNSLFHGAKEFDEAGEDYLPCQTTVDLEMACNKIIKWIGDREDQRKSALLAIEIFDQIAAEEEEKVTALFGADRPVSAYFGRITGGRYREVVFDSVDNMIKVICADGIKLDSSQLSGGAYDQLYISIRLALGESLLEGDKGFFILDDPFIKADRERLIMQLDLLSEICAAGWQVIYFSAKSEVKEALENKIKEGQVKEFSVSG